MSQNNTTQCIMHLYNKEIHYNKSL